MESGGFAPLLLGVSFSPVALASAVITMLASFEVGIKKSRFTISIVPGILKIKWGYSGLYSDNLDVI